MIDPLRAFLHADERIIDRVQDPVEANLGGVELNESSGKIPGRGLKDIILQVKGNVFLHR